MPTTNASRRCHHQSPPERGIANLELCHARVPTLWAGEPTGRVRVCLCLCRKGATRQRTPMIVRACIVQCSITQRPRRDGCEMQRLALWFSATSHGPADTWDADPA